MKLADSRHLPPLDTTPHGDVCLLQKPKTLQSGSGRSAYEAVTCHQRADVIRSVDVADGAGQSSASVSVLPHRLHVGCSRWRRSDAARSSTGRHHPAGWHGIQARPAHSSTGSRQLQILHDPQRHLSSHRHEVCPAVCKHPAAYRCACPARKHGNSMQMMTTPCHDWSSLWSTSPDPDYYVTSKITIIILHSTTRRY